MPLCEICPCQPCMRWKLELKRETYKHETKGGINFHSLAVKCKTKATFHSAQSRVSYNDRTCVSGTLRTTQWCAPTMVPRNCSCMLDEREQFI